MKAKMIAQGAVDGLSPDSGNTISLGDFVKIKMYCLPPDEHGTPYFVYPLAVVIGYGFVKGRRTFMTYRRDVLVRHIAKLINEYKNYSPLKTITNNVTHS